MYKKDVKIIIILQLIVIYMEKRWENIKKVVVIKITTILLNKLN